MKKVKLEDVCYSSSSSISQKDIMLLDGKYPVYGASGLIKNINYYKYEKEYVGIVKDGAGIGRTMILPAKSSVISTIQYILPKDNINIRYLYYVLSFMNLSKYYSGVTIPHIYFKDYKYEEIFLPDKSEQQKIVNKLDLIQEIIDVRKKQIEELDELVKSQFVEMFGNIKENKYNYRKVKFAEICDNIGDGLHGTPKYDENGEYPFINGNNFIDNKITITKSTKFVNKEQFEKHYIQLNNNTIFLSINGTLGKTAFYNNEKIILGKSACYFNLKENINKQYIYGLMNTDEFLDFLESSSTKSTIKNVGLKALREYLVIVPPIDLQNKFAEFVKQIDKQKFEIQKSLEEIQKLQESLMNKYFGG